LIPRRPGLGQCVDPGSGDDVPCSDPGAIAYTTPGTPTNTGITQNSANPFGSFLTPAPVSEIQLLSPSSPGDVTPAGTPSFTFGPIGGSQGCAAGYVVGDAAGDCVPAATLAATLATPAGATSLGLTAAQAATITAALRTATAVVGGTAPVYVAPVTNPFASISSTTWLIGGAALLGVFLLMKKK
jgi:hypothetical protein